MAGAVLAKFEMQDHKFLQFLSNRHLSNGALGIIIASFFIFDESTAHPSLLTVVPIFATVVIIANRDSSARTLQFLSNRILVFIGLVSYSLYLWHFPIFAFARIRGELLNNIDKLVYLSLSLALAVAAFYLVERPLRNRQRWRPKPLMWCLFAVFMGLAVSHSYLYVSGGADQRLGSARELFTLANPIKITNGDQNLNPGAVRLVNLGDSHAGVFGSSVLNLAKKYNANFSHMEQAGCPLVKGVFKLMNKGRLM